MGIKILSFTIKDLHDSEGYLDAIGQEQTANVKAIAAIQKAEADRDAYIKEQECQKLAMDTKYKTDTTVADFKKDFETKLVKILFVLDFLLRFFCCFIKIFFERIRPKRRSLKN